MSAALKDRWLRRYGGNAHRVAAAGTHEPVPGPDLTDAEIRYAVDQEMAMTVADVLVRRTGSFYWSPDGDAGAIEHVADVLDERHHHTPEEHAAPLDFRDNAEAVGASRPASHSAPPARSAVATGPSRSGNRAHHQVAHCLVHFSRHPDGMWLFGEAASLAQVAWRSDCLPPLDEIALFGTFDDEETQGVQVWIQRIYRNIEDLQQRPGAFLIGNRQAEVLAGALG
ncbi:hypothetical protein ADL07_19585 [Streptomyces sp. NRRL F-4707]|uniref:glycerol-3-phosphate dehydrogenase C-terminal domain-containing protein n=1 Tax=Streptomyces TaxID=1883 RepID=UPI0006AD88B5|nr:glycerol-3-phosphate dehydrogenase C-terminal domain-containing protein [Streptomyces sp. NRRL F-4707]KOX30424.1 hypothetical protein ADL07_19585 [Streptomyces sp. NRRL F-4707]